MSSDFPLQPLQGPSVSLEHTLPGVPDTGKLEGVDIKPIQPSIAVSLDAYMQKMVGEKHFSGVAMVVHQGDVILNKGYAMATDHFENGPDTVMHVASVTKQFTAAAIMKLREAGKIDLHKSINEYLPEQYRSPKWESVTVHHLLSHTGGVVDYAVEREYYDVRKGFCFGNTVDGMIHESMGKELEFKPGSAWNYSNIGYTLLGAIIDEQIKGEPDCNSFAKFVKKEILNPVGMLSSGIHEEDYNWEANAASGKVATGRRWDEGQQKLVDNDVIELPVTAPDGGLFTTSADLMKWCDVLTGKKQGIITPESLKMMKTPVENTYSRDGAMQYGYGLFINEKGRGTLEIGHPGGIVGFRSYLQVFPERDIYIAVLVNNIDANAEGVASGLSEVMGITPIKEATKDGY